MLSLVCQVHQTDRGTLYLDLVHAEERLVLCGKRVLGLSEDAHQHVFGERVERHNDREPTDKLGNHSKLNEVMCLDQPAPDNSCIS